MSFEKVMEATQQLAARMEALAAIGARLTGRDLDPAIDRALDGGLAAVGVDQPSLAALSPEQRGACLGFIRAFLRQAGGLVEYPERPPGWVDDDPLVLQGIGRGSSSLAPVFAQIVPGLGDLASRRGSPCVSLYTLWDKKIIRTLQEKQMPDGRTHPAFFLFPSI